MNQLETQTPLERMIQQQIVERGIDDSPVIEAIRVTPREKFFPREGQADVFADRATPIGHGQTISQPYIVALMTQRLRVEPTHRVLEVGTGSGYQAAILARLAAEVWTVERVKPLLDEAWERLMELNVRNVHFKHADGTLGWPDAAPFDRILIGAGAPSLPRKLLLDQLADGGIAVLPVGPHEEQTLVAVTRKGNDLRVEDICSCRFVKLVGHEGWIE